MNKIRDKRVPFKALLEKVRMEIELGWLLLELFFMVTYFCFFIAFVFLSADPGPSFEVNSYVKSVFSETPFPDSQGKSMVFESISSPNELLRWIDNVVLPVVQNTRLASTSAAQPSPFFHTFLWQKQVLNSSTACVSGIPSELWETVNAMHGLASNTPLCFPSYSDSMENTQQNFIFPYFSSSPLGNGGVLGKLGTAYDTGGFYSPELTDPAFSQIWPFVESSFLVSSSRLVSLQGVAFFPSYNHWAGFGFTVELFNSGLVIASPPQVYSATFTKCTQLYACENQLALEVVGAFTAVCILLHFFLFLFLRIQQVQVIVFSSEPMPLVQKCWLYVYTDWLSFFVIADFIQLVLGMLTLSFISSMLWATNSNVQLGTVSFSQPLSLTTISQINGFLLEKEAMLEIFGLQVVLFNIQVFKYFPTLPCLTLPERAWELAFGDVLRVLGLYFGSILAFAYAAYVGFGSLTLDFATYLNSLNSIMQAVLGEITFYQVALQEGEIYVFLCLFSIVFIIMYFFLLQALFLCSVLDGFLRAFLEFGHASFFADFLEQAYGFLCTCLKKSAKIEFDLGSQLTKREVFIRLKAWKARRANEDATTISWTQLQEALRGFTYNHLDVTSEEVDVVFRLVDSEHYESVLVAEDEDLETEEMEKKNGKGKKEEEQFALITALLQLKSDEKRFVKLVTSTIREAESLAQESEVLLKKVISQ